MTTISLHKYHDQINHLIEDNQYSLAANHCRYILQQHPRHVDTYRLLARAMIDQGDYSGAADLFQRVLSADPNDYIAHIGLADVFREEDVLSQSIWHLERAYEIEPYDSAVQQGLKDLYHDYSEKKGEVDQEDSEKAISDRLPLTEGALARLYIQGELYAQAINVLREALAKDEDRIDLEVLLAEALWRDNQRVAAVQTCLQVLDKLPNCITANAVLAEIWLQTGRTDEAQAYLKELQALTLLDGVRQDLESPVGSAFQPEGAVGLPAVFEVERMVDGLASLPDEEMSEGASLDSVVDLEQGDDYQWLEGFADELVVEDGAVTFDEPVSAMTDSGWLQKELEEVDDETAVSPGISDWLEDISETDEEPLVTGDLPDWLDSIEDIDEEDSGVGALGVMAAGAVAAGVVGDYLSDDDLDSESAIGADKLGEEADSFDWLSDDGILEEDLPEEDETIVAQIEPAEEAEEMPDWLADMGGDDLEPVQVDPSEAAIFIETDSGSGLLPDVDEPEEDIFGWLEDVADDATDEELEAGELDLSQFAEFGNDDKAKADDGEIVWQLTDELSLPEDMPAEEDNVSEEMTSEEAESFDDFIFEDFSEAKETGDLEGVPDWLLGSSGTEELNEASLKEEAGSEVADELAEWVAANQPEMDESPDSSDRIVSESEDSESAQAVSGLDAESDPAPDMQTEDDFFTNELPGWMVDSSMDADASSPLDSAPLTANEPEVEESAPLNDADLPDWLMGESMNLDDSGFFETGALSDELVDDATDEETTMPDWLVGDTGGFSAEDEDSEPEVVEDKALPDWLSADDEPEPDEEEDDHSGTAVVGGLLGAMAAGAIVKELLDDDEEDEDQPAQLVEDGGLEDEVTEDAVSDIQDDLFGSLDEPEESGSSFQEDSDAFDWLDDLDGPSSSAEEIPLPIDDLGDDLDWMDLDDTGDSDDLNLDALLGLETEKEPVIDEVTEDEAEPVLEGLAEDESLDWLDALADDTPEAIDELPTWQWPEDGEEGEDGLPELSGVVEDAETIVAEESVEADVVEDLDDAMSWLEDLAAEPDAPVEELPSVAENMDLDDLFESESIFSAVDNTSSLTEQDEIEDIFAADTLNDSWLTGLAEADEEPLPDFLEEEMATDVETGAVDEPSEDLEDIFAADTLNDSWLTGLAEADEEPLPDFLEEEMATDVETGAVDEPSEDLEDIFAADTLNDSWLTGLAEADEEPLPDFLEEDEAFSIDEVAGAAALAEVGEPPEDIDDAMAWLEQLAARQGAPLDELPSVDNEPIEDEDDGMGVAEVVAGVAALGAVGAVLADDDDDDDDEVIETEAAEAMAVAEDQSFGEDILVEDDLMAMDVPEDPDEAMAWLEKLAARQGAPLDELPSVSEDDYIPAEPEVALEDGLFDLDSDESGLDNLLADADSVPGLTEVDDAMAWLDGLEDEDSAVADTAVEETEDELGDLAEFGLSDEEPEFVLAEESTVSLADDLRDELDWLESVTASDEVIKYSSDEVSVSDDDLADALEKLTMLTVAGAAVAVVAKDDESDVVAVVETAVTEPEVVEAESAIEDLQMPEDPDEAMAWLEKLAARQGAPLDELPYVQEDEYDGLVAAGAAMEVETETESILDEVEPIAAEELVSDEPAIVEGTTTAVSPEDMNMEDAMAWLEQLAARQGTSLDELPTVEESDLEGDVAAPDWVADAQEEAEEEPVAVEELVSDEPDIAEEVVAQEDLAEAESMEMPEDMDMDDAMAWLEQLAARQGTPLDELPTVKDVPETDDDINTPGWIATQTGPLDASVLDSLDIPEVSDEPLDATPDEDFFAALDEVPAIEGIETSIKNRNDDALVEDMDDIDDSMPDWLSGGGDSEESNDPLGHTGWLNTLDEPDMDGWLTAEAEASVYSELPADTMPEAVDTDSLISTGGLEDTGGLQEEVTKLDQTGELRLPEDMKAGSMFTAELDEAQVLADLDFGDFGGGLDQAQLESARNSLAGGDIDAALYDYQGLVEAGESMHTVISDLERATELHKDKPMVRRMLGDAYMRNGQINKAIETYRGALDQM